MMNKTYRHVTYLDRCEIWALKKAGYYQKDIADEIGFSASTISRELRRNQPECCRYDYHPRLSDELATKRQSKKPRPTKLTEKVRTYICDKLSLKWSPEQIANRAKQEGMFSISHESIYQFILKDKQGGGVLYKHLRQGNKHYRKRYGSVDRVSTIKGRVSIHQRPAIIDEKKRIGDWEIDTIIGQNRSQAIVTIVERVSKKLVCRKMNNHTAQLTADTTIQALSGVSHVHSITADNGVEFACHKLISKAVGATFYFADPYSSWQRGLNENTNGLLRQYVPKRVNFDIVTDEELQAIEDEINNRPRKLLGYKTPNEVYDAMTSLPL